MRKKIAATLLALCLLAGCKGAGTGASAKIGEPVETEFITFTVSGCAWQSGEDIPQEKELLSVLVEVANTTGEVQPLYYDEFDLEADGAPLFPQRPDSARQLGEDNFIPPGETLSGELHYLVPTGSKNFVLVYQTYYQGDVPGEEYRVAIAQKDIAAPE